MLKRDKPQKKKGFLAGAFIGTIIGDVAGLLLAPKSGKETQDELRSKAKKMAGSTDSQLTDMESQLEGRIDNLKVAARDLKGEAYEDSQRLITRAEILKNDLQDSASRLARTGREAGRDVSADAKRLVNEGQAVISELERTTKKLMASARRKAKDLDQDGDRRED